MLRQAISTDTIVSRAAAFMRRGYVAGAEPIVAQACADLLAEIGLGGNLVQLAMGPVSYGMPALGADPAACSICGDGLAAALVESPSKGPVLVCASCRDELSRLGFKVLF